MNPMERVTPSASATMPTISLLNTTPGAAQPARSPEEQDVLDAALRVASGVEDPPLQDMLDALRAGTDPNHHDFYGTTALHLAARWGNREKIETLLRAGARLALEDGLLESPAHWAAHAGNAETLRALVEAGSSLSAVDSFGYTPERALDANERNIAKTLDGAKKIAATRAVIAWAKHRERTAQTQLERTDGAPARAGREGAPRQAEPAPALAGLSR